MKYQGILGHSRSRIRYAAVTGIMLLLLASFLLLSEGASGSPTRATVLFIGSIEAEGEEEDIVLAGYGWYTCNFTLIDWMEDIENLQVVMDRGEGNEGLFDYDPLTENLTMTDISGQIDVKDPIIGTQDGRNQTISFDILVHMNWTYQTQVTLKPSVFSDGSEVDLDTPKQLKFEIFGYLQPVRDDILVFDHRGVEVRTGEAVLSNSTIVLKHLKFEYDDTSGSFSGLAPSAEEINPVIEYGEKTFNTTLTQDGFKADIEVPDEADGTILITVDLPSVRSEWKLDLLAWSFSLDLDGLGPKVDITKPAPGKTQSDSEFTWNITVTDRPVSAGVDVNGSTVKFRVWTSVSNWTEWTDAPPKPDARSIFFSGTATGISGIGSTLIQFMAEDVLGNVNVTSPYSVSINTPPTLNISEVLTGLEIANNRSLELDGSDYVYDPDGDSINYKWYLDDSEALSTLADFRKPLFDIEPGQHTIILKVSDGHEEVSESFTFTVLESPGEGDQKTWIEDLMEDENLFWYLLPFALVIILIPLIVLILFISRKARENRSDDFIIDEDRSMDMSQAEETAKRILETMSSRETVEFERTADAVTVDEGFDFDYNLYEVLGIESTSSEQEIKKAYRKLAAYFHPDRVANHKEVTDEDAREEMVKINKAKEILLDPEQRELYDSYVSDMDFSMDISEFGDEGPDFDDEWD
jgi:DnaJ-domain-containing protein 1